MDVGYFGQDRAQRLARERVQSKWMDAYAPARHLDPVLVLTALALTGIGLIAIYSAKFRTLQVQELPTDLYITKQLIAVGLGVVAMAVTALIDYRNARSYSAAIYGVTVVLLALVLTPLGITVNGSQSWFEIGSFQMQPAEFAKLGVIVAVAALFHERRGEPGLVTTLLTLLIGGVPIALIVLEPDFGSAMVVVAITFAMLLAGGTKVRYLVGLVTLGVGAAALVLTSGQLQDYQIARLTTFLDDSGATELARTVRYNTDQSMIAIGSGQFFGKGLFRGTQTNLSYVPENHTDFIFTVVAEEFGFLGASLVLGLLALLIWRGLRIALMAKDTFGMMLAAGAVALLAYHVFVNVGMTIGLMPVTGIPLPFVSYGPTALIANFALIGLLLNVHMRRF